MTTETHFTESGTSPPGREWPGKSPAPTAQAPSKAKQRLLGASSSTLPRILAGTTDRELRQLGVKVLRDLGRRVDDSHIKRRLRLLRNELLARKDRGKAGTFHPRIADKFFRHGEPGTLSHEIGLFITIPRLFYDLPLTHAERAVYEALVFFADDDGRARVSLAGIARKARVRYKNVPRYLQALEKKHGLIKRKVKGTGNEHPSVYVVVRAPLAWPPKLLDAAADWQAVTRAQIAAAKQRQRRPPPKAVKPALAAVGSVQPATAAEESGDEIDL